MEDLCIKDLVLDSNYDNKIKVLKENFNINENIKSKDSYIEYDFLDKYSIDHDNIEKSYYDIKYTDNLTINDEGIFDSGVILYYYDELTCNYKDRSVVLKNIIMGLNKNNVIGGIIVDGNFDFENKKFIYDKSESEFILKLARLPFHQYSEGNVCFKPELVHRISFASVITQPTGDLQYDTTFVPNVKELYDQQKLNYNFELKIKNKKNNFCICKFTPIVNSRYAKLLNNDSYNEYTDYYSYSYVEKLINNNNIENIILVAGVGGTGIYFINYLNNILFNKIINNNKNNKILISDFDKFEDRNLNRMSEVISFHDIGFYKVKSFISSKNIFPFVKPVEETLDLINKYTNKDLFIIGCLDSVKSRLKLLDKIKEKKDFFNKIVYIDAGNKKYDGQVMTVYIKDENVELYNDQFENFKNEIASDEEMGCSVNNEQIIEINKLNAVTLLLLFINNILYNKNDLYYLSTLLKYTNNENLSHIKNKLESLNIYNISNKEMIINKNLFNIYDKKYESIFNSNVYWYDNILSNEPIKIIEREE